MIKLEPPYLQLSFDAFMNGQEGIQHVRKFIIGEPDDMRAEALAGRIADAFKERLTMGIVGK